MVRFVESHPITTGLMVDQHKKIVLNFILHEKLVDLRGKAENTMFKLFLFSSGKTWQGVVAKARLDGNPINDLFQDFSTFYSSDFLQ